MIVRLSHIISSSTPTYGNRDSFKLIAKSSIENGDSANTSAWSFSNNHLGTHIDTPNHFDQFGLKTYQFSDDFWFFNKVAFVEVPCDKACLIGEADISGISISADTELLLIRTGFEQFRNLSAYTEDNPGIAPSLADYLRNNFPNLRCIGFDFISLTSWKYRKEGGESHRNFLKPTENKRVILIIEDMMLSPLVSAPESVVVSPLMVEDGNGGPVTVFAKI